MYVLLLLPSFSSNTCASLVTLLSTPSTPQQTDLATLESTLLSLTALIDSTLLYVQQVLSGEVKGDRGVGRYLLDKLGVAELGELEGGGFGVGLQDLLMVGYLGGLVRSQAEISGRVGLIL